MNFFCFEGAHPSAVIEESDNPGVEAFFHRLTALLHEPMLLADPTRAAEFSHPGEAECAPREVAIGEDIGQAEVVVTNVGV